MHIYIIVIVNFCFRSKEDSRGRNMGGGGYDKDQIGSSTQPLLPNHQLFFDLVDLKMHIYLDLFL